MTYARTPTPELDRIWSQETALDRWHQMWITHLQAQMDANPNHPGHATDDLGAYRAAVEHYRSDPGSWIERVNQAEQETRHDLFAALQIFNAAAQRTTAHFGLTSHDIVEHAVAQAVADSTEHLKAHTARVARLLADQAHEHRATEVIARTHGQPAQLTVYGHRIASILAPLADWYQRFDWWAQSISWRHPAGAVGTSADLARVLMGWDNPGRLDLHTYARRVMPDAVANWTDATRQVRHRSYDLHTAALLVELATIANTWATDRRHEATLGLGNEVRSDGQVGSSAMPHKTNPVLCERICSLTSVARGHLTTAAELATAEWMEGDVSGSAGRRHWLPSLFRTVDQILTNWETAAQRWKVDWEALAVEREVNGPQIFSAAAMHWLVEQGIPRPQAHTVVSQAVASAGPTTAAGWGARTLAIQIAKILGFRSDRAWTEQEVLTGRNTWHLHLHRAVQEVDDTIRHARWVVGDR